MTPKQRSQSSIYIEDPDSSQLESVAYIGPVNCNLTADNEPWIGDILGDGSDFELGLHFTLQSNIDVVDDAVPNQMASLGEFGTEQSHGGRLRGDQSEGRGGRDQGQDGRGGGHGEFGSPG